MRLVTSTRAERQALLRGLKFACRCDVCSAGPKAVAASDKRRTELARLEAGMKALPLADRITGAYGRMLHGTRCLPETL